MVLGITRLRDETIERILADPPLVWTVIAPDDPEAYQRARADADRPSRPGFFARLFGATTPPAPEPRAVEPLALTDGEGIEVDFDKSWHGIHYLLTGSAEGGEPPLDFLIEGGREVGDEDLGYGTGRVFTSAETRVIASALDAISDAELRSRFDGAAMTSAGIYPDVIWNRNDPSDNPLEYVAEFVTVLRKTLADAVAHKHGMLITLS